VTICCRRQQDKNGSATTMSRGRIV
jgi:hypothetical protein